MSHFRSTDFTSSCNSRGADSRRQLAFHDCQSCSLLKLILLPSAVLKNHNIPEKIGHFVADWKIENICLKNEDDKEDHWQYNVLATMWELSCVNRMIIICNLHKVLLYDFFCIKCKSHIICLKICNYAQYFAADFSGYSAFFFSICVLEFGNKL